MEFSVVAWGVLVIAAGIFVASYGTLLFRLALAAMGFGIGFLIAMRITEGQDASLRVLISFAAGGIAALVLYGLVRVGTYVAGGILGLILGIVIAGLLRTVGISIPDWLVTILAVAGAGGAGFLAPRFGSMVTLLSSAAAGAFLVTNGLHVLFQDSFPGDPGDPISSAAERVNLAMFFSIAAISFLSQRNYDSLRRRLGTRT